MARFVPSPDILIRVARRRQEPIRETHSLAPSHRLLLSRLERDQIGTVADAHAARAVASRVGRRDLERKADRARRFLSRA